MRYLLVANPDAGSQTGDVLGRVRERLPEAEILTLAEGVDLGQHVGEGVAEERVIVAVGGDGTVHAVAQHVVEAKGIMGVVPGGTLNHFARDLGVREVDVALEALVDGASRTIDVGVADRRVFVNNLGIGMYPEIVRERERREQRWGKWPALAASALQVLVSFDPLEGVIEADGDRRALDAAAVFVGNNVFSDEPGRLGTRERLDEGVLDLRLVRSSESMRARPNLAWHAITRRPGRVVRTKAERVRIELRRPRPLALDGEELGDHEAVDIVVAPGALRVVAPSTPPG